MPTFDELKKKREELIARQQEVARELAALQEEEKRAMWQAESERLEILKNAPIAIEVTEIGANHVYLAHEYNEVLLQAMRGIPGRIWDSVAKRDIIPIEQWELAQKKIAEALPNASFKYTNGTQESLQKELAAPDYEVTLSPDSKQFYVKVGRADSLIIQRIPGSQWDYTSKNRGWMVPVTEGWRLYERLKDQVKVLWGDSALALIQHDIELRSKLDEIALREFSDIKIDFIDPSCKLRPFQGVTVEFTDAAGGRALIAHQMGLGKTWCALGYSEYKKLRTLVVCPASLKTNWAREIKRLTGETPCIHSGTVPTPWDMKQLLLSKSRYHIINYDILAKKIEDFDTVDSKEQKGEKLKVNIRDRWLWVEVLNASKFDVIVSDECHYIKNVGALRSQAARKLEAPRFLGMTGTPVLNRPGELWPILTILAPDKFPSYEAFLKQYTENNRDAKNVDELRELLKPLMIRKLKKDVVKELPPVNRIYEWTELSERAKLIYRKVLEGIYETLKEWQPDQAGEDQAIMSMLAQIMRLRQVVSVDKIDFTSDLAVEINDSIEVRNGTRDPVHKVIVFCTFVPVAHAIAKRLGAEALWMTGELDQNERQKRVDQFKSDPGIRFLVATDKVAGEGLNLQEAYAVVFHDMLWTPAGHEQCEGRAYGRLADAHGIDSYWVTCENTIDQTMQEILARKMNVINQVVEGMDAERNGSVLKELLGKMREQM